jgi:hypothetical protein
VSRRPPLRAALAADFRDAGWQRRLALLAVAFWLAYEWGIGNETVTPWLLANVVASRSGFDAVPAAAVVGFAFTAVQQLLAGLTALAGFAIFTRTARGAWERLGERFERVPAEWSRLGFVGRSVLVFTLGTTAVALVQVMSTGEVGVRRHRRVIVESALLCGLLVALAGGVAAALVATGREVDALSGATDLVLRILGNPLFWLGGLAAAGLIHAGRSMVRPADVERPTPMAEGHGIAD